MTEDLSSRIFSEHLNSTFGLRVPNSQSVSLQLVEVTENDAPPGAEQFSVLFRGPRQDTILQGIHTLRHEQLGELELFLVPIGPDAIGMRYEAVFNRMRVRKP